MAAPMPLTVPAVPAFSDLQPDFRRLGQALRDVAKELAKFKNLPSVVDIYQLAQQHQQQIAAINERMKRLDARYGWIRYFFSLPTAHPHPHLQRRSYSTDVVQLSCIL